MIEYQIRQRIFAFQEQPEFPNEASAEFVYAPEPPFGATTGLSRTLTGDVPVEELPPDRHAGRYWFKSTTPLGAVDVRFEEGSHSFSFNGDSFIMTGRFEDLEELAGRIEEKYYRLPLLVNVEFIDSPLVLRVSGTVGPSRFDWIHQEYPAQVDVTTKEIQEDRLRRAWDRLPLLHDQRLFSALSYFRQACRLERAAYAPFDFAAEVLLNLSKVLEILFHGQNVEAARDGLRGFGYPHEEIEACFIPAMYLRSQMDVAHASLTELSSDDRVVLQQYVVGAESHFRDLMHRVCDALAEGTLELPENQDRAHGPRRDVVRTIEKMRQRPCHPKDA